jgi:hypothetical protein
VQLLRELIIQGDAVLLGIVRQELLTGLPSDESFEPLRQRLEGFDDLAPDTEDYERAARLANQCARKGVAATTVDMLICAVASGRDLPVLTTDADFQDYARHLLVRLHPLP